MAIYFASFLFSFLLSYPFIFSPWFVFPSVFLFEIFLLPLCLFPFLFLVYLFFPFLFPTFLTFLFFFLITGFCKWCTVIGQAGDRQCVLGTREGSPACWQGCGSTGSGWGAGGWASCLKSPYRPWLRALLPGLGRDNGFFLGRDHDCDPEGRLEQCRSNLPYPEPIYSNIHKLSG